MSFNIVSPHDGSIFQACALQSKAEALSIVQNAKIAQKSWKLVPLSERQRLLSLFVDYVVQDKEITSELASMIGRPLAQNQNEVNGFETRARHLIKTAPESLKDVVVEDSQEFTRFMSREPLGVVLVIAAWNYPYLVSVNSVVPALLAGNTVVLKQAPQTFPAAIRFQKGFEKAGLPLHVFQVLQADHPEVAACIQSPNVDYVQFTGSVRGGSEVNKIAANRLIGTGFELGGNDPAYVREDADPINAAENLVDGAMYNSGQSCCGIQRIYVHAKVYDAFVEHAVKTTKHYVLGSPFDPKSNLGPVISTQSANSIRAQIEASVQKGAQKLIDESLFPVAQPGTAFVAPQLLVNVNHEMPIMKEEVFGPVAGIMKVNSDEEAVRLMNDSHYGLTASIWTKDDQKALELGKQLETGTVFMNRCDYLDPALAWVGVKDSGRGCSLGKFGFDMLTRPKSYHLRK